MKFCCKKYWFYCKITFFSSFVIVSLQILHQIINIQRNIENQIPVEFDIGELCEVCQPTINLPSDGVLCIVLTNQHHILDRGLAIWETW